MQSVRKKAIYILVVEFDPLAFDELLCTIQAFRRKLIVTKGTQQFADQNVALGASHQTRNGASAKGLTFVLGIQ